MLHVRTALNDGHMIHITAEPAGSQRPELSQLKKHSKFKKVSLQKTAH